MSLAEAIHDVQEAEAGLAAELSEAAGRHTAEHGFHRLARLLARRCSERLGRLAPFAFRFEVPPAVESGRPPPIVAPAGADFLRDLRSSYAQAQLTEIAWVVLGQVAQAARAKELLEVATHSHADAEMCGKWLRMRIKDAAPQAFLPG